MKYPGWLWIDHVPGISGHLGYLEKLGIGCVEGYAADMGCKTARRILYRLLNRAIGFDGSGGLFIMRNNGIRQNRSIKVGLVDRRRIR